MSPGLWDISKNQMGDRPTSFAIAALCCSELVAAIGNW
jgi:hypothetical protein